MVRSPPSSPPTGAQQIALGVKDNLRHVRLQLRRGARTLAGQIGPDAPSAGAEGQRLPLSEPLQNAAMQMLHWFDAADRMASGLLGVSSRRDQLVRAVAPLSQGLRDAGEATGAAELARAWYVAWNHLLCLQPVQDRLVPEGALHQLLRGLHTAVAEAPQRRPAGLLLWLAVSSRQALLQRAAGASTPGQDDDAVLLRVAAAFAVACESHAPAAATDPAADAARRLALADELVAARLGHWRAAAVAAHPCEAFERELAFHLRHL